MKNTIIYLLGLPAAGKYTVAKELVARTDARLIDNHLINNVIFGVIRPDGKTKLPDEVWTYTRQVSAVVREAVVQLGAPDENYIFTNALRAEFPSDHVAYGKVLDMANRRNATFVPVRLLCDLQALQSRIATEERRARMKMTDVDGITEIHQKCTVFDPDHPNQLELDVSRLTVSETADAIVSHVEELQMTKR